MKIVKTAFILTLLLVMAPAMTARAAGSTLAVLYFDNNSGQKQYDVLGKGMADMLITDLTKYSGLQVVEREKLEAVLKELNLQKTEYFDPKTVQELGKGLGAGYALTGAIFTAGQDMRIDTRVIEVASGRILLAEKVQGPIDRFFDLQVQLTEVFVKGLGDQLSRQARRKLIKAAKAGRVDDLDTAVDYALAIDLADRGDYAKASEQITRVLEREPDFELAQARQEEILKQIHETTQTIKASTDKIEASTQRMEASLEKIVQGFEALNRQGGLIPDPKSAEEYYHNARVHEINGDYGNARRAYLEYFKFDLDFVDPHQRFLTFLKVQEGREGAREVYGYIRKKSGSFVPEFNEALLWNRDKRIPMLEEFADKHPDFAPVYYELSKEYSEDRVGKQTLDDKKKEKKYLDRFIELDQSGKFVRYFLDQEMVARIRKDVETRLAPLKFLTKAMVESPVQVTWMKSNAGWMGTIIIPEPTVEIFYKLESDQDFKSLGHQAFLSQQTGKPLPNMSISLPFTDKPVKVFVKYTDIQEQMRGPFESVLDPRAADIRATKQILEFTKTSWVQFQKNLAYFSHLMSYRGAIKDIKYAFNKEIPDQPYTFPAFDGAGTAKITNDVPIYLKTPKGTRFVTVQLTYKDGTQSEVVKIERR